MRRLHIAVFAALMAALSTPALGAEAGAVTGVVRDTAGIPQMGATVQLLRPDLTVLTSVYTDSHGRYAIPSVLAGRYSLKAMCASFLPSLRENVRVRANTVVNLTLNSLYEAMQWLPAEPRGRDARQDDWAWTLRSPANRPLLRWLEDGPLVVVSDGTGTAPRLKARLIASGQVGSFGESGERITAAVEDSPSNGRTLLARVEFAPGTDAEIESTLGFRQDLGSAGMVQTVAAVALHPEVNGAGSGGLGEAAFRTWQTIHLGDTIEAEAGSVQAVARFASGSTSIATAALPFAMVGWRKGNSTVRYRMNTVLPGTRDRDGDPTQPEGWLPLVSLRDGKLAIERGLHQEIGWERRTDTSGLEVLVFEDKISNPVIEAMDKTPGDAPAIAEALMDDASGLLRAAGPGFSSAGVVASFARRLPGGNRIRLSYANGNALVLPATPQPVSLGQLIAGAHPRHVQTYSLALSGTLDGTGTRWRASYRWQPEDTVTQAAPFAQDAAEPYLNVHIRQPIRLHLDGTGGFEALLDIRNLLAEGYQPYLLSDGSLLVFAQDQRSIRARMSFTF